MNNPADHESSFELRPGQAAAKAAPGDRLELVDGTFCTVVDNPVDGVWLYIMREGGTEEEGILLGQVRRLATSAS